MLNWKMIYKKENEKNLHSGLLNPAVTYQVGVPTEIFLPMVRKYMLPETLQGRVSRIMRSRQEFQGLYGEWRALKNYEDFLNNLLEDQGEFYFPCYCEVCEKEENMIVEKISDQAYNWREGILCPACGFGNHKRFWTGKVKREAQFGGKVLMLDGDTTVYRCLEQVLPNVQSLDLVSQGMKALEIFQDETFALVAANDVFERVEDMGQVFEKLAGIMHKDGKMIFTTVFDANSDQNMGRIYGWEILEQLKTSGFSDAYAVADFSINEGYLGYLQIYFEAIK